MLLVQKSRSTSIEIATIPLVFIKHSILGITSKRYKSPNNLKTSASSSQGHKQLDRRHRDNCSFRFGVIDWFPLLAVCSFQAAHALSGLVMPALSQLQ